MPYFEQRAAATAQLALGMTGPVSAETYDIDLAGQDDGLDRGADRWFRVLLQLGNVYMIHLYVIGIAQPGSRRWMHTFWTKDCAVYEVEREEHGAPLFVRCAPYTLPRLLETFALERADAPARRFRVDSTTLEVAVDDSVHRIEVRWSLDGGVRELSWSAASGWSLREDGAWRALVLGERVTFLDPVVPPE